MCGRFVQLPVIDFGQPGLADLAPGLAEIQPSYNLAPTRRCWPPGCGRTPAPSCPTATWAPSPSSPAASSGVSADIHDRMPVWLQAGQIDEWMAASPDDAMAMLLASEPPAMEAYRVSRAVNTPRNNREELLLQVA